LAFCGKRKHKLAVNGLAVGPRLEIKVLDDLAARSRANHFSDFD
jgi:hypothetical protein